MTSIQKTASGYIQVSHRTILDLYRDPEIGPDPDINQKQELDPDPRLCK